MRDSTPRDDGSRATTPDRRNRGCRETRRKRQQGCSGVGPVLSRNPNRGTEPPGTAVPRSCDRPGDHAVRGHALRRPHESSRDTCPQPLPRGTTRKEPSHKEGEGTDGVVPCANEDGATRDDADGLGPGETGGIAQGSTLRDWASEYTKPSFTGLESKPTTTPPLFSARGATIRNPRAESGCRM